MLRQREEERHEQEAYYGSGGQDHAEVASDHDSLLIFISSLALFAPTTSAGYLLAFKEYGIDHDPTQAHRSSRRDSLGAENGCPIYNEMGYRHLLEPFIAEEFDTDRLP